MDTTRLQDRTFTAQATPWAAAWAAVSRPLMILGGIYLAWQLLKGLKHAFWSVVWLAFALYWTVGIPFIGDR